MTERICHHLTAIGIETGAEDVRLAVEADRKRKLTQGDVTRAVRAVKATGAEIGKVEITRDKITVELGKADDANEPRDASLVAMDRIAALRRVK